MAYSVDYLDSSLDSYLSEYIEEFNQFFGINWTEDLPNIFIVRDRKMINSLVGKETSSNFVGWSNGKNLFILDKENFEKESSHVYSDEEYLLLLRHELIHCFCNVLFPYFRRPLWLREGIAVYLSNQYKNRKKPKSLNKFLGYFNKGGKGLYTESGFAVSSIILEYGKDKFFDLIKSTKDIGNEKDFDEKFKEIYGFDLNYENINRIYK